MRRTRLKLRRLCEVLGAGALALMALTTFFAVTLHAARADVADVCKSDDNEDDDETADSAKSSTDNKGGTHKGEGLKFDLWGACAEFSGSVNANQQRTLSRSGGRGFVPVFTRQGTPSQKSILNTITASARLETTRQTSLGELKTVVAGDWSADDDTSQGTYVTSELLVSLAGVTVGYTDSLMNFWAGDFSFTATAPARTVGLVSYEGDVTEDLKFAAAVESGPPTTRAAQEGLRSITTTDPVFTARLLYETDDLTLHLSGLVRQAKSQSIAILPLLATSTRRTGWAASLGATIPVTSLGEDDEFSMQATYAVDASPYLGTVQDLSSLSNIVRTTGPTVGWSAVASLSHGWSEQWKSNAFVSYLALDAETRLTRPSVRTKRAGVNLQFLPVESVTLTAELGYVKTDLDNDGAVGFFNGASGDALVGYVTAEWRF